MKLLSLVVAGFSLMSSVSYAYSCRGVDAQARAQIAELAARPSEHFSGTAWYLFVKSYDQATGTLHFSETLGLNKICETSINSGKSDTFCYPWTAGTVPYVYITNTAIGSRNAFIGFGTVGADPNSIGLHCSN